MGFSETTSGQKTVISVNGFIRLMQVVIGVATIGCYAQEKGYWLDHGLPSKLNFEFATASLSILTGLAFGILPFKLTYRPVALAAPWDMVMVFLYSASFGIMEAIIGKFGRDDFDSEDIFNETKRIAHEAAIIDIVWVNLAGMAVFLASAFMGASLLWIGRRDSRSEKHSVV